MKKHILIRTNKETGEMVVINAHPTENDIKITNKENVVLQKREMSAAYGGKYTFTIAKLILEDLWELDEPC